MPSFPSLRVERDFSARISFVIELYKRYFGVIAQGIFRLCFPLTACAAVLILFITQSHIAPSYLAENDSEMVLRQLENHPIYFLLLFFLESLAFVMVISISNNLLKQYLLSPTLTDYEHIKTNTLKSFRKYLSATVVIFLAIGIFGATLYAMVLLIKRLLPLMSFLFIIGVGIFSVYSMFTFIVMEIEKANIYHAIQRSFQLVEGYWWESVGFIGVLMIMIYFLGTAVSMPFILFLSLYELHDVSVSQETRWLEVLASIFTVVSSLGGLFLFSLLWIAIGVHYFYLVEVKEMVGLKEQIDLIGKPVEVTDENETY